MRYSILMLLCLWFFSAHSQEKANALLSKLDLSRDGLSEVKVATENGDYDAALSLLTKYYKERSFVNHLDFVDGETPYAFSSSDSMKAFNGMKHKFFVHYGYGCLDYGDTINWKHWPVKDNEIRWQVNRMYWWIPMAKLYHSTKDEKIVDEWIYQYRDWIKDNPLGVDSDIDRYSWRPLEVARRVQDGTNLFEYYKSSDRFDASFLLDYLSLYYKQANHVRQNYSEQGNHLLFEAQRMIYAGCYFPEFKDSEKWRQEGISILAKELKKQIFEDGFQYELSPNYHVATIEIFRKALRMAELSGLASEFPKEYKPTIEKMIMSTIKIGMTDLTYPMFGDAKRENEKSMRKKYKRWQHMFPNNPVIAYFATRGKEGVEPEFRSTLMKNCGFFSMRSGWDKDDIALVMKAGPSGHFHCQPDNGTFSLMYKNVLLMPDAGCYVYSGGPKVQAKRESYRRTDVHQTLTVDNKNISLGAFNKKIDKGINYEVISFDNHSYSNGLHHREIYFVDNKFFLVYDKLTGNITGETRVRFQVKEGESTVDATKRLLNTHYDRDINVMVQDVTPTKDLHVVEEDLTVSYSYRSEVDRKGIAFLQSKQDADQVEFYTIVYPYEGKDHPDVEVKVSEGKFKIRTKDVNPNHRSKGKYQILRLK
ncbi:heparinase II/III family protein [Halosquirtibacter xylanolyticus]|uniref:heparinase II/III family protein n=1 Tax=Halosquirtibacter xylanolyticus TaxID=3374599 RepID=UPI00374A4F9C|nr:heparinase II/III family protein [Prolixibacteraceae bacterium]